jgi:gliding motility-associated-like protein
MNVLKTLFAKTLAILLLSLTVGAGKAFANHIAAADLFAEFIGVDSLDMKYKITLILYRDCAGTTPLGTTANVTTSSILGGFSIGRNLPMVGPAVFLDQLCPNLTGVTNRCVNPGSPFPGFERRIYIDTVTVPVRSRDLTFSFSLCCRNTSSNLTGQGNFYIEAGLNNLARYDVSTPRYTIEPIPYFCPNQRVQFLNGPQDLNATPDSLYSVSLQPQISNVANVTYTFPYNFANPVSSVSGYAVGTVTGAASFTTGATGLFVLAFRTYKYDRYTGEYLGYTARDVAINVVACATSNPAAIDTIPTNVVGGTILQPGNLISICPNSKVTFDVIARSAAGANMIKLTSDNATMANGSTFIQQTSVGGVATGKFEWTPTTADIGYHVITFTSEDTTCTMAQPIILKTHQVVTIRVLPGLDVGPDRKICPLGDNPVALTVNGPPTNTYTWTRGDGGPAQFISCLNCPSVTVTPPYDYTYIVSTNDPSFVCKKSDTIRVTIDNTNWVTATQDPLVVCRPGYVTLTSAPGGPSPVSNLSCGTTNPQICTTPDLLVIGATGNVGSAPANTPFNTAAKYHKYQFIITKEELKNGGLYSGTLSSIAFKHNNPTVLAPGALANLRVSLKCTRNSRYPSTVTNGDFETGTILVASIPSYTLTANDWNVIPFTTPYNWDTSQNLLVDICIGDAAFTPGSSTSFDPVDMVPGRSIHRWSNTADVCAGNANDVQSHTQRPTVRFAYCQAPNLPFNFQWAPGTYLADSNVQNPIAYVPRSGKYAVYSWGRNGCTVRDSLKITVPIHHLTLSADTSVCVFQPAPLHATGASVGYIWYENGFNTPTTLSCNNCADPIATPVVTGDTKYTVVYLDTAGCFDTLSVTVHAYPLPVVAIGNNDTTIHFGQSVRLRVTGANSYVWTPVGSLSDPNIPNPIATPTVTTDYIVFGLNQYNCSSSDTVRVTIDNRDNLLIPSGFTPNNDGKNDYFRIVNVTFQKLMEFRVFNRWGQEVFSTTDPQKGWDGTWKGVAQDVGSYPYIIRVAYPDGFTETYKGDVTLIR